jgi:hypothetical protein
MRRKKGIPETGDMGHPATTRDLPVVRPASQHESWGNVSADTSSSVSASSEQFHLVHVSMWSTFLGHQSEPLPVHIEAAQEPPTPIGWRFIPAAAQKLSVFLGHIVVGLTIEYR